MLLLSIHLLIHCIYIPSPHWFLIPIPNIWSIPSDSTAYSLNLSGFPLWISPTVDSIHSIGSGTLQWNTSGFYPNWNTFLHWFLLQTYLFVLWPISPLFWNRKCYQWLSLSSLKGWPITWYRKALQSHSSGSCLWIWSSCLRSYPHNRTTAGLPSFLQIEWHSNTHVLWLKWFHFPRSMWSQ